jgi:hypothetical protein
MLNSHTKGVAMAIAQREFSTFTEFYPVYLSEHANRSCRELHFTGTTLALLCLAALLLTGSLWWLLAALASHFGFAWTGHFAFEPSQPASMRHPVYTFMGDWVMYWQMLTGQDSF